MKRFNYTTTFLALISMAAFAACSSSPKGAEEEIPIDDGGMPLDAQTDAVPQENPEELSGVEAQAPVDPAAPAAPEAPALVEPDPIAQASEPAAPVAQTPTMSGEMQDYTVQTGDTLMRIAFENYGDLYRWKDVLETNRDRIKDSNVLPPGLVLKLEKPAIAVVIERNGEKYLIKRGDTLGSISQDVYGTPARWKDLWNNNRQLIQNPNRIFAGFFLYYVPEQGKQLNPAPLAQPAAQPAAQDGMREPAADGFAQ